jgi:hypothetical protein
MPELEHVRAKELNRRDRKALAAQYRAAAKTLAMFGGHQMAQALLEEAAEEQERWAE